MAEGTVFVANLKNLVKFATSFLPLSFPVITYSRVVGKGTADALVVCYTFFINIVFSRYPRKGLATDWLLTLKVDDKIQVSGVFRFICNNLLF